MSLKTQEQHTKAANCCKEAAKHHEAAAHHAQCAQGHQTGAKQHADEAAKMHLEEHGHK